MPLVSIFTGILLAVASVTFWAISDSRSFTALIPSVIGLVFVVLGVVALNSNWQKHAMHAAATWALLSLLASASGVLKGIQYLSGSLGGDPATHRPLAYAAQSVVAVLSVIFIVLAVRSFIVARKSRQVGS